MLGSIIIEPNLWPDRDGDRMVEHPAAPDDVPDRARRLAEAEQIMRSRLNWQGTGAHLSGGHCWWLMTDTESNMLRLVLLLLDNNLWHDDVPRVMQGAVEAAIARRLADHARQRVGHAGGGEIRARLRVGAGHGHDHRVVRGGFATDSNGRTIRAAETWAFAWPPAQADLRVDHYGSGNPWVQIRTRAAIPLKSPFSSGYRITRTLSAVDKTHSGGWRRGDIVRVHLKIEAQTDMTWVVVNDPLPAGASHLGTGLRRDSAIATAGENLGAANVQNNDYYWPDFIERPFDAFRAYYRLHPQGHVRGRIHDSPEPGRHVPDPDDPRRGALRARDAGRAAQRAVRGRALNEARGPMGRRAGRVGIAGGGGIARRDFALPPRDAGL